MDSLSIINEVEIEENSLNDVTAITISIKSYNYLCRMAMKPNLFAHMKECSIEMEFNYFIDLISIAHMAECNYHKTSFYEYMAS